MTRYRVAALLTSLGLTFGLLGATARPGVTCRPLRDLYSQRAIARMKRALQFHLYETRIAKLERARLAIEHRISVSDLLDPDVASASTIEGPKASRLKQTPATATTHVGATQCL